MGEGAGVGARGHAGKKEGEKEEEEEKGGEGMEGVALGEAGGMEEGDDEGAGGDAHPSLPPAQLKAPIRSWYSQPPHTPASRPSLPSKPPPSPSPDIYTQPEGTTREAGRTADGGWDWGALRRGVRDERGDVAFYEAGMAADPWGALKGGG